MKRRYLSGLLLISMSAATYVAAEAEPFSASVMVASKLECSDDPERSNLIEASDGQVLNIVRFWWRQQRRGWSGAGKLVIDGTTHSSIGCRPGDNTEMGYVHHQDDDDGNLVLTGQCVFLVPASVGRKYEFSFGQSPTLTLDTPQPYAPPPFVPEPLPARELPEGVEIEVVYMRASSGAQTTTAWHRADQTFTHTVTSATGRFLRVDIEASLPKEPTSKEQKQLAVKKFAVADGASVIAPSYVMSLKGWSPRPPTISGNAKLPVQALLFEIPDEAVECRLTYLGANVQSLDLAGGIGEEPFAFSPPRPILRSKWDIILPQAQFEDISLDTVMRHLQMKSQMLARDNRGIAIVLDPALRDTRVSISAKQISLSDALSRIADSADATVTVEKWVFGEVAIVWRGTPPLTSLHLPSLLSASDLVPMQERLMGTHIAHFYCESASLQTVLDFLQTQSENTRPPGVVFTHDTSRAGGTLTLDLRRISLLAAVRYVCLVGGYQCRVTADGVHVSDGSTP